MVSNAPLIRFSSGNCRALNVTVCDSAEPGLPAKLLWIGWGRGLHGSPILSGLDKVPVECLNVESLRQNMERPLRSVDAIAPHGCGGRGVDAMQSNIVLVLVACLAASACGTSDSQDPTVGSPLPPQQQSSETHTPPLEASDLHAESSAQIDENSAIVQCSSAGCSGSPTGFEADGTPIPEPLFYFSCELSRCSDGATYDLYGVADSPTNTTCSCTKNGVEYKRGDCQDYFVSPNTVHVQDYCGVALAQAPSDL